MLQRISSIRALVGPIVDELVEQLQTKSLNHGTIACLTDLNLFQLKKNEIRILTYYSFDHSDRNKKKKKSIFFSFSLILL